MYCQIDLVYIELSYGRSMLPFRSSTRCWRGKTTRDVPRREERMDGGRDDNNFLPGDYARHPVAIPWTDEAEAVSRMVPAVFDRVLAGEG